jgi:ribulose-5-phosphate 4-epimerase/fuculose-1-phosphate aldolase
MNVKQQKKLIQIASLLSKVAELENEVPNLDAMPPSELKAFWSKWHRATKQQAVQLVGVRKDANKIVHTLAAYAIAKASAMELREEGDIRGAMVYEKHCDLYYEDLPEDCRW